MTAKSPLRVRIDGPAGAGKTSLIARLCKHMRDRFEIAVIANESCLKKDARFLSRSRALEPERVMAAKTRRRLSSLDLIFVESPCDETAADLILHVIDVLTGTDMPRGEGAEVAGPDLLIINKIDLALFVGANLGLMEKRMRAQRNGRPFLFTTLRGNQGVDYIASFIAARIGSDADKVELPEFMVSKPALPAGRCLA